MRLTTAAQRSAWKPPRWPASNREHLKNQAPLKIVRDRLRGILPGFKSHMEFLDGSNDFVLIVRAETVVKRQPHQTIAPILGDRAIPFAAAHPFAHEREVERHIMKYAEDAARLQK